MYITWVDKKCEGILDDGGMKHIWGKLLYDILLHSGNLMTVCEYDWLSQRFISFLGEVSALF